LRQGGRDERLIAESLTDKEGELGRKAGVSENSRLYGQVDTSGWPVNGLKNLGTGRNVNLILSGFGEYGPSVYQVSQLTRFLWSPTEADGSDRAIGDRRKVPQ
jgi:hypothetical protein